MYPLTMASASLWLYRILVPGCCPWPLPPIRMQRSVHRQGTSDLSRTFAPAICPVCPRAASGCRRCRWARWRSPDGCPPRSRPGARDSPMLVTATTATGLDSRRSTVCQNGLPVVPCPLDLPGALGAFFRRDGPRAARARGDRTLAGDAPPGRVSRGCLWRWSTAACPMRPFAATGGCVRCSGPCSSPLVWSLARSPADAERFAALGVEPCDRSGSPGTSSTTSNPTPSPFRGLPMCRHRGRRPARRGGGFDHGRRGGDRARARRHAALRPDVRSSSFSPRATPNVSIPRPRSFGTRGLAIDQAERSGPGPETEADVFLLDTIGELARAYRSARWPSSAVRWYPPAATTPWSPRCGGCPSSPALTSTTSSRSTTR